VVNPIRTWLTSRGTRRTALTVLLVLTVVLAAGLVGLSPIALRAFRGGRATWERLSFIGETYGAASALLSALALVGIAITLVLQARDTKVSRDQGQRILHVELLKMAMDNPVYRRCWGPIHYADDAETELQHIYTNLILSEWQTSFEVKSMDERLLRAVAARLFTGEVGRRFWVNARETRIATSGTRRERRFHRIIDEEFRAAEANGPPIPHRQEQQARTRPAVEYRSALVGAILAIGVAFAFTWLRRLSAIHVPLRPPPGKRAEALPGDRR
jgi:hypothetical protein